MTSFSNLYNLLFKGYCSKENTPQQKLKNDWPLNWIPPKHLRVDWYSYKQSTT